MLVAEDFGVLLTTYSEDKKAPRKEARVLHYSKRHYLYLPLWMETMGEQLGGVCWACDREAPVPKHRTTDTATSSLHISMGCQKLKAT